MVPEVRIHGRTPLMHCIQTEKASSHNPTEATGSDRVYHLTDWLRRSAKKRPSDPASRSKVRIDGRECPFDVALDPEKLQRTLENASRVAFKIIVNDDI